MGEVFSIGAEVVPVESSEGPSELSYDEIKVAYYGDETYLSQLDTAGVDGIAPNTVFETNIILSRSQLQELFEKLLDLGAVRIPLHHDRGRQIELMETAQERVTESLEEWRKHPEVREALSRKAPGQP